MILRNPRNETIPAATTKTRSPTRRPQIAAIIAAAAILATTTGCTWTSQRPVGAARGVFNLQPSAGPVGEPAFERAMDRVTGTSASTGNRVTLLQNGDENFPAMLEAIRGAQYRISMQTYIVDKDEVAAEFYAALIDAAARGVEVRFIGDAIGFRRGRVAEFAELEAGGVRTRIANPMLASWTILRLNNRDHRKILVTDGTVAFMGGLNVSADQSGDGVTGWRDTGLRVEGPAAADAERVFARSWAQAGRGYFGRDWPIVGTRGLKTVLDAPFVAIGQAAGFRDDFDPDRELLAARSDPEALTWNTEAGSAEVRVVWTDPVEASSPVYEAILLAIDGATESVEISTAYFAPPRALRKAITAAARRGVRVRLLLPGITDVALARPVSQRYYGTLLEAGVEIREWPHFILHSKTMVVDGRWSLVGSANLDSRSFSLSYEASFAVMSAGLGRAMEEAFEADWERSIPVTREEWTGRAAGLRLRDLFLATVAGQY